MTTNDGLANWRLPKSSGCHQVTSGMSSRQGASGSVVAGIDPRRPKYPISATPTPDGKGCKCTAENVALLLQGVMKDVSPKA